MKRRNVVLLVLLLACVPLMAQQQPQRYGGGGLSRALANALYCQLAGCTMTGALTASSAGIVFNGSVLTNGGANIVRLANTTTAQTVQICNTCDSNAGALTNYEIGVAKWNANAFELGTENGGTGSARSVRVKSANTLVFATAGTDQWSFSTGGVFLPGSTNSKDIGSSTVAVRTAYVATSIQGSATKTLTETSATGFVTITIPNSGGCAGKAVYTVFAADATNTQLVSGELFFSAAATSGGTVTAAAVSDQHVLNPVTSGTLTNTMTSSTAANALTLLANATSSLTQTTLEIRYRIELQGGTCTVTGL